MTDLGMESSLPIPSASSHTGLSPLPQSQGSFSDDSHQLALFFSPLNYPEKKKKQ